MKKTTQINYFKQKIIEYVNLRDTSEKTYIREDILDNFQKIKTQSNLNNSQLSVDNYFTDYFRSFEYFCCLDWLE